MLRVRTISNVGEGASGSRKICLRCSHAPSKTPLASCPKSIPKLARSLQGEVNNWHKGRARIKMRNLRLTFWGLAAMVTLLWLLADLSVFRSSDRKRTRLNSSHSCATRLPSYACKKKTQYEYNKP